MVKELLKKVMEKIMMVLLIMENLKLEIKQQISIRAILLIRKRMAKGYLHFQMEMYLVLAFKMENNMAMEVHNM